MDFIDLVGLIFFVLIGVGFPSYVVYIDYQARKKKPWRELAASTNLTYKPAKLFGRGDCITGLYRGYHLTLDTIRRDPVTEEARTRITLSIIAPMNGRFTERKIRLMVKPSMVNSPLQVFTSSYQLRGQIKGGQAPVIVRYAQSGIEIEIEYLREVFELLCDVADAYLAVVALGGEIVPSLQVVATKEDHPLQQVVTQLLYDIGRQTTSEYGNQPMDFLCPHCLTRYAAHKARLSEWKTITYYGCRICGQSRDYLELARCWVIAVLDNGTTIERSQQKEVLRINWLVRRTLFDFDEVEIVQATDEEVERFAVQAGNDTDPARKPLYKKVRCVISSDCRLSENTVRILRRMFGRVEIKKEMSL